MNIAIASSGLGHITRGIEAWAHDLAHALRERNQNVILCKGAGAPTQNFERTIPCIRRSNRFTPKLPNRVLWRFGLGSPYDIEATTFSLNLIAILRRENIDILHVQDPLIALHIQRARKLRLVKTKVILGHGTNESPDFLTKIEFLQHLAPCHQQALTDQGLTRPTWTAIPNFIDTETFHPGRDNSLRDELSIPHDATVVLSVAAIKKAHKRIDHLINEFAALNHPGAHLVIAGGHESDTDELLALGNNKLGHRFHPLVRFPREHIPSLYRASDIFAFCSLREMMPIALIEATATGLPCLVHNDPSLTWIAGPGGRAIDMAAPGALAAAIRNLIDNPSQRNLLGESARNHCLVNFSKEHVVSEILNYYRFVLAVGASTEAFHSHAAAPPLPAECCDHAVSIGK